MRASNVEGATLAPGDADGARLDPSNAARARESRPDRERELWRRQAIRTLVIDVIAGHPARTRIRQPGAATRSRPATRPDWRLQPLLDILEIRRVWAQDRCKERAADHHDQQGGSERNLLPAQNMGRPAKLPPDPCPWCRRHWVGRERRWLSMINLADHDDPSRTRGSRYAYSRSTIRLATRNINPTTRATPVMAGRSKRVATVNV